MTSFIYCCCLSNSWRISYSATVVFYAGVVAPERRDVAFEAGARDVSVLPDLADGGTMEACFFAVLIRTAN